MRINKTHLLIYSPIIEKLVGKEAIIIFKIDGITEVSYEMLREHQEGKKSVLLTGLRGVKRGQEKHKKVISEIGLSQAKRTS